MDLDGLVMRGSWSLGPAGAKSMPALIALEEALLLLGLPPTAGAAEVRSAHRAAIGVLQAQLQAGTLDRPGFRALVERLDVALRSALAATRASGPATSGPESVVVAAPPRSNPAALQVGQPAPGPTPAAGAGSPAPSPTPIQGSTIAPVSGAVGSAEVPLSSVPPAGVTGEPPDLTSVTPVHGGSSHASSAGPSSTADALQRASGSDPAATVFALKTMPLMNQSPPTRAQHDLWTAVLVPAAGQHVEAATELAATMAPRTDPQSAAVVTHVALTLALADLPEDQRRALLPLAAGVYAQLEAVLPSRVLAGLPPRDLLGGLPIQLSLQGPEVWLTALLLALAVVTFAIWAGLR